MGYWKLISPERTSFLLPRAGVLHQSCLPVKHLYCNDIDLYLHLDDEADSKIVQKFDEGVKRLLNHEPLNYVLGYCWFYGYKLLVNSDVIFSGKFYKRKGWSVPKVEPPVVSIYD